MILGMERGTGTRERDVLDGVRGLHGTEESIVEDRHEETLCQVIEVLP